ncbi:gallate 1-beta-glucosyltransferase 84A24-like [Andrographis paniculata]|uniref:gallate 1-beta-glucosyltransferase 84A24-like n=1 Tax=Andrographis paniculata TaxID=175694 RepID=UPI0021E842B2|nr:gallate 1-beta-glucosyltransferase 84A24-like [Andrographis paniculata]
MSSSSSSKQSDDNHEQNNLNLNLKLNLSDVHVFLVSFPGQGHVNPLLRLGKRLAALGLSVTFSAPEIAGASIRKSSKIAAGNTPTPYGRGTIRFEFFDDGWDLSDDNRNDLDSYMAQLELVGKQKLLEIIGNQNPPVSCLINNPFIPWVSDVAAEMKIPCAVLWVQSCACFSAYYHYYHKLVTFPMEESPEIDVRLPSMPALKHDEIPSFLYPGSPYDFLARAILGQFGKLEKLFCVLMDTFEDLEVEIINSMSGICGLPIRTVGPLFRPIEGGAAAGDSNAIRADFFPADDDCTAFLDSNPPASVVYVSFGSVVHFEQEQADELAYGLRDSGVPFLWVMRPAPWDSTRASHVLPEGYLEEIGDRGKIVQWSPQEKVLDHPSLACFVTHCGWNSTVEALASGVPAVAFPQWGDQVTNAKFLVDVFGVGVRLGRGEAAGRIVPRGEIAECLRAATAGPTAEKLKENAARWKKAAADAVAEGGSSYRNIVEFVEEVVRVSGRAS